MIKVDHIFIFSNQNGIEADELVRFGLKESEGRYHIGQGTTNRKFLFQNFFLELLWVVNEQEINSSKLKPSMLFERADFQNTGYSPFGLCLVNTPETDGIFKDSISYQPDYFPKGKCIDVVSNKENLSLPWIFRLPFRKQSIEIQKDISIENKMNTLSKAIFGIEEKDSQSPILSMLSISNQLEFQDSKKTQLTLEFDQNILKESHQFKKLPLTLLF